MKDRTSPPAYPPKGLLIAELFALALAAVLVCVHLDSEYPFEFWDIPQGEHTELSLTNALHLETRLREGRNLQNLPFVYHPGIPTYFINWLALRAALPHYPPGTDVILYSLEHPEYFFAARRWAAVVVGICGLMLLWIFLRPYGYAAAWVGMGVYAHHLHSWVIGLTELVTDSAALPAIALFFICLRGLLWRQSPRPVEAFALGVIAGICYSIKLPYLAIFISGLAALLVFWWKADPRGGGPRELKHALFYCLGALAVVLFVIPPITGLKNFLRLIANHLRVMVHSGRYGDGGVGLPDAHSLQANIYAIFELYSDAFFVMGAFILLAAIHLRRRAAITAEDLAMAMACGFSLFPMTLSVVKHYSPHYTYMLAMLSAVTAGFLTSIALGPDIRGWRRRGAALAGAVSCAAMVAMGYSNLITTYKAMMAQKESAARDLAFVRSKPRNPDELIVWIHGSHGKPITLMETLYAGGLLMEPRLKPAYRRLLEEGEATTVSGVAMPEMLAGWKIRYLISPKMYFKPEGNMALHGPMCLPYEKEDTITELTNNVLIEKARPIPPEEYLDPARCGKTKWVLYTAGLRLFWKRLS